MLLLPVPEVKDVKNFKVSLLLTIFLILCHYLVESNRYHTQSLNFSETESKAYFNIQSRLYERHLEQLKKFKSKDQRLIASVFSSKSLDDKEIFSKLTRVSILDSTFDPLEVPSAGLDQIEYQDWLGVHNVMRQNLKLSPAYLLGLNNESYGWDRWLSYMFVHVGIYHLLSNALFLLLFGALIETVFGGVIVTLVFLGSGFLAAPIYMYLSDLNQVSLVGASGGVCGLIAFYSLTRFKSKIRFFYWVLPFEKYYGFLALSTGYILVLWILGDLAGYFAGVSFLDNVAHAAHLGGFVVGSICALVIRCYNSYINTTNSRLQN